MALPEAVHNAVAQVCPIDGISFPSLSNQASWIISFKPEATAQQRLDAQTALTNFDIVGYNDSVAAEATRVTNIKTDTNLQTLLTQARTATVSQIDTWISNNVTTLAQARTVLAAIIKYIATIEG